ncbi:MAG TPA: hypothetical protein VN581_02275 [Patescibacteria group bacterium]|nr:hypothetical protein [Patescibacteria group bacterium]
MKPSPRPLACAMMALMLASGFAVAAKTEGRVDIVTEGGIGKTWGAAPGASFAAPGYPAAMKDRAVNVCVSLGYTLNAETGAPDDLMLLQSWSRDKDDIALTEAELEPFVQSAASALAQWRFVPKEGAPKHVTTFTSATMTFNGEPKTRPQSLPGQCRITDLPAFVGEEGKGRDRVNQTLLDRMAMQGQKLRQDNIDAANRQRQAGPSN